MMDGRLLGSAKGPSGRIELGSYLRTLRLISIGTPYNSDFSIIGVQTLLIQRRTSYVYGLGKRATFLQAISLELEGTFFIRNLIVRT